VRLPLKTQVKPFQNKTEVSLLTGLFS